MFVLSSVSHANLAASSLSLVLPGHLSRSVVSCFLALSSVTVACSSRPFGVRRKPWFSILTRSLVSILFTSFDFV